MKVDLSPAEVKFIKVFCLLDLEAIGFSAAALRTALGLRQKLVAPVAPAPVETPPHEIGLRVLRLTPTYRHSDK